MWEWIKYKIRDFSINFSKSIAKEKRKENELLQKFDRMKSIHESNPSDETFRNLEEVKASLELLEEANTEGIIVRATARWHELGEKSNKYFLNLEKRNHVRKHVRKLQLSRVITTDPFKILEAERTIKRNYIVQGELTRIAMKVKCFLRMRRFLN